MNQDEPRAISKAGDLTVDVIEATNLPAMKKGGTADPYVRIKVGEVKFTTKVIKKSLAPKWNQQFTWKSIGIENLLVVKVFDEDIILDEQMGEVRIDLRAQNLEAKVPMGKDFVRETTFLINAKYPTASVRLRIAFKYMASDESVVLEKKIADPTIKDKEEMEKLKRQHQGELEKLKQPQPIPSNAYTGKTVGEWSVGDVQGWVSSLGAAYGKYGQLLVENGVDGENLLALDRELLTALGVNAAHAAMITQKLKSRTQVVASPSPSPSPSSGAAAKEVDLYAEVVDLGDKVDLSKLVINKNKKLGEGNFGEVCMGAIGDRQVAVKILSGRGDKKEEIKKEISTWEKVGKHENVAQLFGVIEKDGSQCIVMNYYPGGSLKEELDDTRKRGLALRKVKTLSILVGIANGLKHLHQHKIVHRDLAARNILFENSARDRAVITDFGLSREVGQQGGKDYYMMHGGPLPVAWMPPETLLRHKSTLESDVWSFGVVVWEVITQGLTPLSNLDVIQIGELAGNGKLQDALLNALENVEDGDPELVKVVEMCLVADPALRPPIDKVADTLQALFIKASKGK